MFNGCCRRCRCAAICRSRSIFAGHNWFFNGMGKEQIDKVGIGYEERYGAGLMK